MNLRSKLVFGFILLPCVSFAQGVVVNSQNIKELIEAKNAKVQVSKSELEAAEKRTGSFGRSFIPNIEFHASQETFKKGQQDSKTQPAYGAEASVNLFNGGKDHLESSIRDLEAGKKSFEAQKTLVDELEKARSIYWELTYLQEKKGLLEKTLEVNKQNLAAAQRRIRSGVATDSDRFEFEMKNVDLQRDLKDVQLRLVQQKRVLGLALGFDAKTEISLNEALQHDHDYESKLQLPEKTPEFLYKDVELAAKQNELLARQSGRSWMPRLDAYAGYNQYNEREEEFPDSADRKESVMGLRLSLNLSQSVDAIRESAAQRKLAAANSRLANHLQQESGLEIQKELEDLRFLHDQIHDAEENISRAESYYRMTQSEYARGVKNSPDVLGASEKLYDMRNKRLEIIKNFQTSKAHLLSKVGL